MNKGNSFLAKLFILVAICLFGCSDAEDLIDVGLNKPSRKPIDTTKMGINNFFVNQELGSISDQYADIKNTLGLRFIRVLFAWTDGVQPTIDSPLNFSFYDQIIEKIPSGVDVLIVVAHQPSWMASPDSWMQNNPRFTWTERFLRPTVSRYAGRAGIIGWEVWNEPDVVTVPADAALELTNPSNYIELLSFSSNIIRKTDPGKFVVMAATESIQQDFPNHLDYNRKLRDSGAQGLVDIWNVHYYGTRYESVVTKNGVSDFLNSLSVPIWITESGEMGPNKQLAYVEEAWPFLLEKVPGIGRIYYYEYSSPAPIDLNYGLRTTDAQFPVSDLYIHLRDRDAR